ncbi:hypothetical protein HMPREF3038_01860 [Akkermansia sp. KLE1797]|nr:hypothetical protein HMPREF3038_01860 [Akkermansia sp. KLE1797]KXU54756.1 hypothetical protein HMPREF3039_01056 [Akkermansia sp. KLE1798]KZA05018.1 hypothetical protein HMPREF1326_01296 [Akkermansia sp. KLE1605]
MKEYHPSEKDENHLPASGFCDFFPRSVLVVLIHCEKIHHADGNRQTSE